MDSNYFNYLPDSKVQCPKCGQLGKIPLSSHTGSTLEYFGVCESQLESGGRCSSTLALQVVAHQFPLQQA